MEILLNLVWASLAVCLVQLWARFAPREGGSRRIQIVALAMLIVILFPVISVSDDLQAAQNPAEDDIYLRRDHAAPSSHSIVPVAAVPPRPVFAEIGLRFAGFFAPIGLSFQRMENPALDPIQNRPPPAA